MRALKAPAGRRAFLALAGALLLFGALARFHHAWSLRGVYNPSIDREEGYYETGISMLACHLISIGIPDSAPAAARGTLYPAFIASLESLFRRPSPGHVRLAQALLAVLGLLTVLLLGWRLHSPAAGLLAAAWMALDAEQVLTASSLNVHGFYSLLLLATAAVLVPWIESRRPGPAAAAALVVAAGFLCRSAHFPLPFFLAAAAFFWWGKKAWRALALPAALVLLFLTPRLARDALHFGELVPLDGYAGAYVFLKGTTGPGASCTVSEAVEIARAVEPGFQNPGLAGQRLQRELMRVGVKNALRHPVAYAGYCAQRLWLYWKDFLPALLLALLALLLNPGNKPLQAAALVLASLSGYAFAGGALDHRPAALPLLALLAGCGLASALRRAGWGAQSEPGGPPPRALLFLPAVFAAAYAAMAAFLFLDVKDQWLPRRLGKEPVPCAAQRVVDVLGLAAIRGPREESTVAAYVDALARRAWLLGREGRGAEAERLLREALLLDPRHRQALGNLARLLADRDSFDSALAVAARLRAGAGSPGALASARALRDYILTRRRQRDAAARVRRKPDFGPALARAARLCGERKAREALETLDGLTGLSGRELAESLNLRALARLLLGDANAAREALRRAGPRACGRLPPALERSQVEPEFFSLCLELTPGDAQNLLDRGVAFYVRGRAEESVADLRAAWRARPGSRETGLSLAVALEAAGRGAEAAALRKRLRGAR